MQTIHTADAMGLLEDELTIDTLDKATMDLVATRMLEKGLGKGLKIAFETVADPTELDEMLEKSNHALRESPSPDSEWKPMLSLFGVDALARLLSISPATVRRASTGERPTSDLVAARLHFLALLVGDLSGTYNDFGIRRWFARRRSALGGRAPQDILGESWDPESPEVREVEQLAHSLSVLGAT